MTNITTKAKKKFGQNFLIDQNILNKIIKLSDPNNKNIIEIGPGTGNLTLKLLESEPNKFLAVEIDSDLILNLQEKFKSFKKFKIINEDILKIDFKDINKFFENKKYNLVANLPYNISSRIIFAFLNDVNLESISIMLQKELVDRIISKPGSKSYGRLTIALRSFFKVEDYFVVSKNNFRPVPKVESAFIKMNKRELFTNQIDEYLNFIKTAFSSRRKTLLNNFKNDQLSYNFITKYLKNNSIDLNIRAEQIEIKTYKKMWKEFESGRK